MPKVQKLHRSTYKESFAHVDTQPANRHLSHEQAAEAITRAGKAQSSSRERAVAFLESIGVVGDDGKLTERYR